MFFQSSAPLHTAVLVRVSTEPGLPPSFQVKLFLSSTETKPLGKAGKHSRGRAVMFAASVLRGGMDPMGGGAERCASLCCTIGKLFLVVVTHLKHMVVKGLTHAYIKRLERR